MLETDYCTNCGKRLPKRTLFSIGQEKVFEFKDGLYCEACAKIKVKRART